MISRFQIYAIMVVLGTLAAAWAYHAIGDAAVQRDRNSRAAEGVERQTDSDAAAERARRLSAVQRCKAMARQSGMEESSCGE